MTNKKAKNKKTRPAMEIMRDESRGFTEVVMEQAERLDADNEALGWLRSCCGSAAATPNANGFMAEARQRGAIGMTNRIAGICDSYRGEFLYSELADDRWSCGWDEPVADLRQMLRDSRPVRRQLAPNGIYMIRPWMISGDGLLRFKFCSLLWGQNLSATIMTAAEVQRRTMHPIGEVPCISVTPVSGTPVSFASVARKMWSLPSREFLSSDDLDSANAHVLRVGLQMLMIPFQRLIRGEGEGEEFVRGITKEVKGWAAGNGNISTTHAHPERLNRDLAHLMNRVGLGSSGLPYVLTK